MLMNYFIRTVTLLHSDMLFVVMRVIIILFEKEHSI